MSKVEGRCPLPSTKLAAGAVRPGAGVSSRLFLADEAGSQPTGTGGVNSKRQLTFVFVLIVQAVTVMLRRVGRKRHHGSDAET